MDLLYKETSMHSLCPLYWINSNVKLSVKLKGSDVKSVRSLSKSKKSTHKIVLSTANWIQKNPP